MAKRGAQGASTIRKKTVTRGGKSYEYWEARVTVGRDPGTGKQVQRSFSGKTQKEVREKMQAAAVQVNEGTYTGPEKMTLAQWLEIWEREYLGDIKPLSVAAYHVKIHNHIIPALGAIPLQSLSPHMIQGFYNALSMERDGRAALSAKTVKTIHGVLHRALGQAMQNGYIRANPSDPCKLPRVIKKEMHPLDDAQIPLFLAAIRGDPYETFVVYCRTIYRHERGRNLGPTLELCEL